MNFRLILPVLMALALAGTNLSAAGLNWPNESITTNSSHPTDEEKLLRERFAKASAKSLGVPADDKPIAVAALAALKNPKGHIHETRWLTPSLVMVSAGVSTAHPVSAMEYFVVLEKSEGKWHVIRRYLMDCI